MESLHIEELLQNVKKRTGYDRLEKREKLTVILGAVFLAVFVLFHFMVMPLITSRSTLQRAVVDKKVELRKIVALQKEYQALASEVGGIAERVEKRSGDFTLFSFLERQATTAKVKERVKYMKPSVEEGEGPLQNSVVEMKVEAISLVQLVEFLKLVESPANVVSIGRMSIQENGKDGGLLDVVMQILTFEKKS